MSEYNVYIMSAAISAVVAILISLVNIRIRASRTKGSDYKSTESAVTASASDIEDNDEEDIAAIATVVIMNMSENKDTMLVIREIKYIGTCGSAWSAAGRQELMS